MAESEFERTEAPTPRRLEEARREGNVARSTDLTAASILLASVLLLHGFGSGMLDGLSRTLERQLGPDDAVNVTLTDDLPGVFAFCGQIMLQSTLPAVLGLLSVALLASLGQTGFLLTAKPLMPNFGRLSPIRGLRNLVDGRAGIRLFMSIAKVCLIAAVAGSVIAGDMNRMVHLAEMEIEPMFVAAATTVFWLALKLAILLVLMALLDYAFQRWRHLRDLRMSKQDVKDELKRMEGDPLVRQRRASVARQLTLQRIGHAVPNADVVVTNPTHYSVALQYNSGSMNAPKVVAKGADLLALRIRQLAAAHGVPMVERRELAQAIYRTVEVGQEVPPQFYNAIAEILAYVYRLGGRKTA